MLGSKPSLAVVEAQAGGRIGQGGACMPSALASRGAALLRRLCFPRSHADRFFGQSRKCPVEQEGVGLVSLGVA
jgi:hypothetical protein